jgi:hypothetical protein
MCWPDSYVDLLFPLSYVGQSGVHNTPCSQVYSGKTAWSICVPATALSNVHLPLFHQPPVHCLHQGFLTYQLGPKSGKTCHLEWVAIILINKLKVPNIQA